MSIEKEKLEELRHEAELAVKKFKHVAEQIDGLGFRITVQPDNTVYLHRHILEEYGEKYVAPGETPEQANKYVKKLTDLNGCCANQDA